MIKEPEYWEEAKAFLRERDPVLKRIIASYEEPPLRSKGRVFETLVHSIVGQQISAKAADAVWGRFLTLVGPVEPASIPMHSTEALRGVGLSGRKVEYIQGLARDAAWVVDFDWSPLSDDDVRKKLTKLRGVGPWTAEMVLIFSLLRADIFPLGDIGIVRAIEELYADRERLEDDALLTIAKGWAPYRTVAVWYLWRHLDAEPVEY
jgi:DNA-3-methyladenine glycosylase II